MCNSVKKRASDTRRSELQDSPGVYTEICHVEIACLIEGKTPRRVETRGKCRPCAPRRKLHDKTRLPKVAHRSKQIVETIKLQVKCSNSSSESRPYAARSVLVDCAGGVIGGVKVPELIECQSP